MFTINDYLDDILEEFEDYVHSGIRLCDLKSVHFDAGKFLIIQIFMFSNCICFVMHMHTLSNTNACIELCSIERISEKIYLLLPLGAEVCWTIGHSRMSSLGHVIFVIEG